MKVKFGPSDKPDFVTEELYAEAKAMKNFFGDETKYTEWIKSISIDHSADMDEAEKAAITGIVKAHKAMIVNRGEDQAEWFKEYVGLQKFFDAYEEFKGDTDGGKH